LGVSLFLLVNLIINTDPRSQWALQSFLFLIFSFTFLLASIVFENSKIGFVVSFSFTVFFLLRYINVLNPVYTIVLVVFLYIYLTIIPPRKKL
jgi:hypothetical protein